VNEPWLALFAAINPAAALIAFRGAVSDRWGTNAFAKQRLLVAAAGVAVAVALYALLAFAGEDLLDGLDIAPETFRIAAGIVMAASGVFAIWRMGFADDGALPGIGAGVFPLGVPLLASAAGLMAALSYGVDHGSGRTFFAAVVIVGPTGVLAWLYRDSWRPVAGALARITGALLIAVAAALVVEGVRDV
jgi:small neutral amino acid transporter SnatA (MarC family)